MAGLAAVPWIQVALVDLQNAQAGPLVVAFQSTALAMGQADPTPQAIADITDQILGSIGFSGRYTMDASQGTVFPNVIPPNLKNMAVRAVCRFMKGRLEMPLRADETEDGRTFERTLQLLRDGRFPIDATSNPSGSDIAVKPGLVAINYGYRRQFQPHDLSNL